MSTDGGGSAGQQLQGHAFPWVLSVLGVPAPAQALWVSQRILVSAYEKRRGEARGGDASKWPVSLPHSRE